MKLFKEGDRVFDFKYGWGFVHDARCPIIVRFSEYTVSYAKKDLKTLSFTEYTLQGFSQERPIVLPGVGELCLVRDDDDNAWLVREFVEYRYGLFICRAAHSPGNLEWKYMKRIKIID